MTDDSLISQAYELLGNHDRAKEITQCGMHIHLLCLVDLIMNYITLTGEDYGIAEPAFIRAMEIIRLFNIEALDMNVTAKIYLYGAGMYCRHRQPERALEILEKYTVLCECTTPPFWMRGDSFFSDIEEWLNSGELGASIQYDEKMVKHNMLQGLYELPALAVLRDEPRYMALEKRLKELNSES